MQIQIKTVNLELNESTETYTREKVGRVAKFLAPHQDEAAVVEVHLRVNENDTNQTKDQCTITISGLGKGHTVHAEAEEPDMHVAIDRAYQKVEEQLRREKEKRREHIHGHNGDEKHLPPEATMDTEPVDSDQ